jgi:hypothetical protein
MKSGLSRRRIYIKSIASLLLFIISSLLVAECLHSHKGPQSSKVVVSQSADAATLKQAQPFCEFCDYIFHQSSRLVPAVCYFTSAPVKLILAAEFTQSLFVYTFNDLLLFSGSSPPRA